MLSTLRQRINIYHQHTLRLLTLYRVHHKITERSFQQITANTV